MRIHAERAPNNEKSLLSVVDFDSRGVIDLTLDVGVKIDGTDKPGILWNSLPDVEIFGAAGIGPDVAWNLALISEVFREKLEGPDRPIVSDEVSAALPNDGVDHGREVLGDRVAHSAKV